MRHRGPLPSPPPSLLLLGALALGAGCSSPAPFRCSDHGGDVACNATAGERCLGDYCATPVDTATCPSGFRYTRTAQSPDTCAGAPMEDVVTPDVTPMDDVQDAGGTDQDAGNAGDAGDAGGMDGAAEGGADACPMTTEICDGVDDDCNGHTDEGCPAGVLFLNEQAQPPLGTSTMNGTMYDLRCADGEVLTGVQIDTCKVTHLQPVCSAVNVVADTSTVPYTYRVELSDGMQVGDTGCTSNPFETTQMCPAGQIVRSLALKIDVSNQAIYTLGLGCSTPLIQGPAPYRLTFSTTSTPTLPSCPSTDLLGNAQSHGCGDMTAGVAHGLTGKYNGCVGLVGAGLVCLTASLQLQQ